MKCLLSSVIVICLAVPLHAAPIVQSFDSNPADWVQINNPSGANNFGFRNSNNTGGVSGPGEAGGTFQRSNQAHFYVDTTIGGSFSLTDSLQASGELDVIGLTSGFNTEVLVGYMDSSDLGGRWPDFVGLSITEQSTGSYRARAAVASGNTEYLSAALVLSTGVDREFGFQWDPNGGGGSGLLSLTVSGPGGGILNLALTPGQRAALGTFDLDAFGLSNQRLNPNNGPGQVFIDNLSYGTTAVPEPTTSAIWLLVGLSGVGYRRLARRKP